MKYLVFVLIFLTISCSKQKSILICGDHKCINKAEAKQYFEDNLTIEIQIVENNKKTNFDLVDLNIGGGKQDLIVFKSKNNKVLKELSKDEIKAKKNELKNRKIKLETKSPQNNIAPEKKKISKTIETLPNKNSLDICVKLEKCDIDSITDYLIKASKEKDFPNISKRE
tara:strand:+ start:1016 stop:1522 length:507 start_codon:yes stop_codon:yes gene_type:complete